MGKPCQDGKALRYLEMRARCDKIRTLPTLNLLLGGAVASACPQQEAPPWEFMGTAGEYCLNEQKGGVTMPKVAPDDKANSKSETKPRPYAPSWIDRLTAWVERLPGPSWLYYLGLGRCYRCLTSCPQEAFGANWWFAAPFLLLLYNATFMRWFGDLEPGEKI
jgi:hypothetical protein